MVKKKTTRKKRKKQVKEEIDMGIMDNLLGRKKQDELGGMKVPEPEKTGRIDRIVEKGSKKQEPEPQPEPKEDIPITGYYNQLDMEILKGIIELIKINDKMYEQNKEMLEQNRKLLDLFERNI